MAKNKKNKPQSKKMTLFQKRIVIVSITSCIALAALAGMIVAILTVVGVI